MKTENMKISWVYQSILNWEKIRHSKKELKKIFNKSGGMFSIFVKPGEDTKDIHAYPGYWKGKLYFHLIGDDKDKEENFTLPAVPVDLVTTEVYGSDPLKNGGILALAGDLPIPVKIAILWITNWVTTEKRNQWITDGVLQNEMYQAFSIPADNFSQNEPYIAYFALKESDRKEAKFDADLVLYCEEDCHISVTNGIGGQSSTFYDTCRPVPPFKPIAGNLGLLRFVEKLKV